VTKFIFFASLCLVLLGIVTRYLILYSKRKREKRKKMREKEYAESKKRYDDKEKKEEARIARIDLKEEVWETFSVDIDKADESVTRDEIIRNVNLVAQQVSYACVNQIKVNNGEKIEPYITFDDDDTNMVLERKIPWNKRVGDLKKTWYEVRQLALQVIPNFGDKMPHFSEFEPLKSYNEKYLLQKTSDGK